MVLPFVSRLSSATLSFRHRPSPPRLSPPPSPPSSRRIIFIDGPILNGKTSAVISQLFHLDLKNPDEPINIYINSSGGNIADSLGIYDAMQAIRCPISIFCIGQASSTASLFLTAGALGKRFAFPLALVGMYPPDSDKFYGNITHEITQREIRHRLDMLYANHTGRCIERIMKEMGYPSYMCAEEAKTFGFIDHIIKHWSQH